MANVRSQCAFALMEISYSLHEKMQIAVVPLDDHEWVRESAQEVLDQMSD